MEVDYIFIGSKNFEISRNFYQGLGFEESPVSRYVIIQNRWNRFLPVKDWINNSMIFLEIEDVDRFWNDLLDLDLTVTYENVKLIPIRTLY